MPRTELFRSLMRAWRVAEYAETHRVSTREALTRRAEHQAQPSRRHFLGLAGAAVVAATPVMSAARKAASAPRIAIVGGGLAGLACADRLEAKGYSAVVYEADTRLGGRCYSNRDLVPGMACENGGELIDTGHKAMLGYARQFGLRLESYVKKRGADAYYFFGQRWSEEEIVDQFRQVVAGMQDDLHAISGAATFYEHSEDDLFFDRMTLADYFASRCAGLPLIRAVLDEAYLAEFGLETANQSALNFIGFMRLNRQSKFEPFGVSDERFHLVDGNDGIVTGLADRIEGPIHTGATLTRLGKTGGRFRLYFEGAATPEAADAVVLTVPFSVLRGVLLEPSLGLSADKVRAIDQLGYGTNAKTMIAFEGRPWATRFGASGGVYSDRPHLQDSWESNRGRSTAFGIITDYASGERGASLKTAKALVQEQVSAFLDDFSKVLPGMKADAALKNGKYVAHLEHWPSNPYSSGSYTCYRPGQFTGIAGLEAEPVGSLKFAGEHTDSFYSWQGFMEGACLSGIRAADEILADIKTGAL